MASTEEPEDPFDGLVLDEDFVRGATRYEPPARTREAIAKNPEGVPHRAWDRGQQSVRSRARRAGRRPRQFWITLVVVAAVLVGVGYYSFTPKDSTTPTLSSQPSSNPTPEQELADRVYERGHCYAWDQDLLTAPVSDVACSKTHLYEHVVTFEIDAQPGAPYPTDDFEAYERQYCDKPVLAYLGGPIDPSGNLYVTSLSPLERYWRTGDRTIDCGIGRHTGNPFVANPDKYDEAVGAADQKHQVRLDPIGTCYRKTAGAYGTVACSEPHSYEVTGVATVSGVASAPSNSYYDRTVSPVCARQVRHYLGRGTKAKEVAGWDLLSAASWAAGTRQVQCYLEFEGLQQSGSHQAAPQKA